MAFQLTQLLSSPRAALLTQFTPVAPDQSWLLQEGTVELGQSDPLPQKLGIVNHAETGRTLALSDTW